MKKKKINYADVAKAFAPPMPGEVNEIRKRAQLAQATGDISLITDYKKFKDNEIIAEKNLNKDIVSNNAEVNDDTKVKEVNEDTEVKQVNEVTEVSEVNDVNEEHEDLEVNNDTEVSEDADVKQVNEDNEVFDVDEVNEDYEDVEVSEVKEDNNDTEVKEVNEVNDDKDVNEVVEDSKDTETEEIKKDIDPASAKQNPSKKKKVSKPNDESIAKKLTDENYDKLSEEYDVGKGVKGQGKAKINILLTKANKEKLQKLSSEYMMPAAKMMNFIMYAVFDADKCSVKEVVEKYNLISEYKSDNECNIVISILDRYQRLFRELRYRHEISASSFFNQMIDRL